MPSAFHTFTRATSGVSTPRPHDPVEPGDRLRVAAHHGGRQRRLDDAAAGRPWSAGGRRAPPPRCSGCAARRRPASATSASTASPDRAKVGHRAQDLSAARASSRACSRTSAHPGQHAWAPTRYATVLGPMSHCGLDRRGAHCQLNRKPHRGGHTHASHDTHLRPDRLRRDGRGDRTRPPWRRAAAPRARSRCNGSVSFPNATGKAVSKVNGSERELADRGRAHPVARRQARQRVRQRQQARQPDGQQPRPLHTSTATPSAASPCPPSRRAPPCAYARSAAR